MSACEESSCQSSHNNDVVDEDLSAQQQQLHETDNCNWCRQVNKTFSCPDILDGSKTQLKFCSDKCLSQYKMHLFCTETQKHIQQFQKNEGGMSTSDCEEQILITPDLWSRSEREITLTSNRQPTLSIVHGMNETNEVIASVEHLQQTECSVKHSDPLSTRLSKDHRHHSGSVAPDPSTLIKIISDALPFDEESQRRSISSAERSFDYFPTILQQKQNDEKHRLEGFLWSEYMKTNPLLASVKSESGDLRYDNYSVIVPPISSDNRSISSDIHHQNPSTREPLQGSSHSRYRSTKSPKLGGKFIPPHPILTQHKLKKKETLLAETMVGVSNPSQSSATLVNPATIPTLLAGPFCPPGPPITLPPFPPMFPMFSQLGIPPIAPPTQQLSGNPWSGLLPPNTLLIPYPVPVPIPIPIPIPFPVPYKLIGAQESPAEDMSSNNLNMNKCQTKSKPSKAKGEKNKVNSNVLIPERHCISLFNGVDCTCCSPETQCRNTSSSVPVRYTTSPPAVETISNSNSENTSNSVTSSTDCTNIALDLSRGKSPIRPLQNFNIKREVTTESETYLEREYGDRLNIEAGLPYLARRSLILDAPSIPRDKRSSSPDDVRLNKRYMYGKRRSCHSHIKAK